MINEKEKTKYPVLFLGTYQMKSKRYAQRFLMSALQQGVRGFDTAPSYGTEQLVGKVVCEGMKKYSLERQQIMVVDKIDAWQMQAYGDKIDAEIRKRLQKMQLDYLDLLLIHWPFREYFDKVWLSMLKMKKEGIVRGIGICNVNLRVYDELLGHRSKDEQPDVIQIERHPYNTCTEVICMAKENNVIVQAYSPVCRMKFAQSDMEVLKKIGQKYNKTPGQVILRWHLDTGVIPIVKTQSEKHISENLDITNFALSQEEILRIEAMNRNYKMFPESWGCPGF